MVLLRDDLTADDVKVYEQFCERSAHALLNLATRSTHVFHSACDRPNHCCGDRLDAARELWDYVIVSSVAILVSALLTV